jgi:hypothetical protein
MIKEMDLVGKVCFSASWFGMVSRFWYYILCEGCGFFEAVGLILFSFGLLGYLLIKV